MELDEIILQGVEQTIKADKADSVTKAGDAMPLT